MKLSWENKAQVDFLDFDIFSNHSVDVYLQRDDLLHPKVSGNKWRKLKYVLSKFDFLTFDGILSFGGAHSNHLVATSEACKLMSIPFVACVRGDESLDLTPSLKLIQNNGHIIHWIDREEFRNLRDLKWPNPFPKIYPNHFILAEGGSGKLAMNACSEISEHWDIDFDYACCSIGTGTTFSGMINGLNKSCIGLGFVMLKDRGYLDNEIQNMVVENSNYKLIREFHCGGFGKVSSELIQFMNDFYDQTQIRLDPVYTGKLMLGITELIKRGVIESGSKVIAIHTGGLQGVDGMNRYLKKKNMTTLKY